jgi:hypothetical protein
MPYIVTVRGRLMEADPARARQAHDAIVTALMPRGQALGSVGHTAYLNLQDPREFLAIDRWERLEGLQQLMSDPAVGERIGSMFETPPQVTIWAEAGWMGY